MLSVNYKVIYVVADFMAPFLLDGQRRTASGGLTNISLCTVKLSISLFSRSFVCVSSASTVYLRILQKVQYPESSNAPPHQITNKISLRQTSLHEARSSSEDHVPASVR